MHTFVFDRFTITPRLALCSPVRDCGKTTVLSLLARLTRKARRFDHVTPAALFRAIDRERTTLLIDEGDNLDLATNGTLRAVLNSGHSEEGTIWRTDKGSPRAFS